MLRLFNVAVDHKMSDIYKTKLMFNMNRGIWCSRLFDSAALPIPVIVGWSGILVRKLSILFLNESTLSALTFLMYAGSKLKILAPLTPYILYKEF